MRAAERRQKLQLGAVREGSWEEEALKGWEKAWVKQGGPAGEQTDPRQLRGRGGAFRGPGQAPSVSGGSRESRDVAELGIYG